MKLKYCNSNCLVGFLLAVISSLQPGCATEKHEGVQTWSHQTTTVSRFQKNEMTFVNEIVQLKKPDPEHVAALLSAVIKQTSRDGPQTHYLLEGSGWISRIEVVVIDAGLNDGGGFKYLFHLPTVRPCLNSSEAAATLEPSWKALGTNGPGPHFKSFFRTLPDRTAQISFSPNGPSTIAQCTERVHLTIQIN